MFLLQKMSFNPNIFDLLWSKLTRYLRVSNRKGNSSGFVYFIWFQVGISWYFTLFVLHHKYWVSSDIIFECTMKINSALKLLYLLALGNNDENNPHLTKCLSWERWIFANFYSFFLNFTESLIGLFRTVKESWRENHCKKGITDYFEANFFSIFATFWANSVLSCQFFTN